MQNAVECVRQVSHQCSKNSPIICTLFPIFNHNCRTILCTANFSKTELIFTKLTFEICHYLVLWTLSINLRNVRENADRPTVFLRWLWDFFTCWCGVCFFQFVRKFRKKNWIIEFVICVLCKKLSIFGRFFKLFHDGGPYHIEPVHWFDLQIIELVPIW